MPPGPALHTVCPHDSDVHTHPTRRVVLTGGPGAGKTAVLEVVRHHFCERVVVLPESATIVFGGGFPRYPELLARRRAQLAIAHVQDQMERMEVERGRAVLVMCDRGVPDGLAYWPGEEQELWHALGTNKADVLARYDAVIHMRTPSPARGYDHSNPLRVESAEEASRIDARIAQAWEGHPRRYFVESTDVFLDKVRATMRVLDSLVPPCCRAHIAELAAP